MSLHTTLIDAASLAVLPPNDVLIVDCRFDLADPAKSERDYLDGHIPGAASTAICPICRARAKAWDGIRCRLLPHSMRCCRAGDGVRASRSSVMTQLAAR